MGLFQWGDWLAEQLGGGLDAGKRAFMAIPPEPIGSAQAAPPPRAPALPQVAQARQQPVRMASPYGGSDELENYTPALPQVAQARNAASSVSEAPTRPTPSVIPQARGAQAQQAPVQSDFQRRMGLYDQDIAAMRAKLKEYDTPPDYSQLQQQARQSAMGGIDSMRAAIAAGMGPRDMQGLQQGFSRQAFEAMNPMKIEGGQIDASGNVMLDPAFQRNKRIAELRDDIRDALKNQDSLAAREASQELIRLQQQANREARAAAAQARADELKFKREQADRERWKHVTDPVSGEVYLYDSGAKDPSATLKRASTGAVGGEPGQERFPKLTDSQGKAVAYGSRMREASDILESLGTDYSPAGVKARAAAANIPLVGGAAGAAANLFVSEKTQQAEQAQRNFINAVLRRESGAVISDAEFANAREQYFPQPGDDPATIEQKRQNRELAIRGMQIEAGPGSRFVTNPYGTQPGAPRGPAGDRRGAPTVAGDMSKYGKRP